MIYNFCSQPVGVIDKDTEKFRKTYFVLKHIVCIEEGDFAPILGGWNMASHTGGHFSYGMRNRTLPKKEE